MIFGIRIVLLFLAPALFFLSGCQIHPYMESKVSGGGNSARIFFKVDGELVKGIGLNAEQVDLRVYDASDCPKKKTIMVSGRINPDKPEAFVDIPVDRNIEVGMMYRFFNSYCRSVVSFVPSLGGEYDVIFLRNIRIPGADNFGCIAAVTHHDGNGRGDLVPDVRRVKQGECPLEKTSSEKLYDALSAPEGEDFRGF